MELRVLRYFLMVVSEGSISRAASKLHITQPTISRQLAELEKELKTELFGLLDMGILVEPVEYQNYETFPLPATDLWGVLLHIEHPLAGEETLTLEALHNLPLIIPQRALSLEGKRNRLGNALKNASVIATYNILSNAALLVHKGLGCAVCLYGGALPRLSAETKFIPFSPERVSKSVFVWKKGYKYNPASEIFIQDLKLFFTKNNA